MSVPLKTPPPLVTNEAAIAVVGTALWAVALVVLLLSRTWLRQHDALWWIWVGVVGVGSGFIWGPYAIWRRRGYLREIARGHEELLDASNDKR